MEDNSKVIQINIEKEMKNSYLDYAMSVIMSRALPDVRDGLKPVHRRILYAMSELGVTPDKPHRKSARIVGDVLGKYHPHGDSAVYDAMVRLAQDFSTRYMLVDGHGNFGSVDGDSAAAMRYTEARMSKISQEMLRDIDKQTVDYRLNFDETLKEPVVLPSRYPNLLVNGTNGIAVGMATSIPPHNLGEVVDGTIAMIDNPDITTEELLDIIKGPDFPTGAIIHGKEAVKNAYRTGRGKVRVRAKSSIEVSSKGKESIIITEIPYQVNKARLIEKIADLVRDKKVEGISDLRDESDRNGMRIVVEIKRDANANIVLNNLYKHTQLETTISAIMIALVDGQPKVLTLREILYHYIKHQKEVITRRTQFELKKAEARAHILEGFKKAFNNIDPIIELVKSAESGAVAKADLVEKYDMSETQAQAILDMKLQRLTGLERDKIDSEYEELKIFIEGHRAILRDEELLMNIIREELSEVRAKYADERRTKIKVSMDEINIEDMIKEENVVITLTHLGYVKRMPEDTYKLQKRGGRGVAGLTTREEDFVENIMITSTHDHLLFFTNKGKVYTIKAYEIPEARRQAKGTAIVNLIQLEADEKVNAIIPIREFSKSENLVFGTKDGLVKKTELSKYSSIRKSGLIAINLREGDELISVRKTSGMDEMIIVTKKGMSIRFEEEQIRTTGRSSSGVKGIELGEGDHVVSMSLIEPDKALLTITEKGYGKRTKLEEYRPQNRAGKGIKTYNLKDRTGDIVGSRIVEDTDEIMLISISGIIIRIKASEISTFGRITQGVKLMNVGEDDKVVALARVVSEEDDDEVLETEIEETENTTE